MIVAVVGAGGKTSLIKEMASRYREEGKKVFVTTTTQMFLEEHTLCTDDAQCIISQLEKDGYVMAGISTGEKIKSLSKETYEAVCKHADVVFVEADGSKHMPLKCPNATEPVIPENAEEIWIVYGLHALGKKAIDCCHRLELVKKCIGIEDDTVITPEHVKKLVDKAYVNPLKKQYPDKKISVIARQHEAVIESASE